MATDISELPRHFLIARSTFDRPSFNWNNWEPKHVKSPLDLPPYLILGDRNDQSFKYSELGWECKWQGSTQNTYFTLNYDFHSDNFRIHQTWQGVDGIQGMVGTKIRLDKFILQHMHTGFPQAWDEHAKLIAEKKYQIVYLPQQDNAFIFAGMPDGFFRTIGFVVSAQDLQMAERWVDGLVNSGKIRFPMIAKIQRVIQVINYVESRAPEWTRNDWQLFTNAFEETGFPPLGLPVREVATDGTAAWTIRRIAFAIFVSIPFAGLMDFLSLASTSNGPIRPNGSEILPLGLKPIIIPAGNEITATDLEIWDTGRTTRCTWIFRNENELDEFLKLEADMYLETKSHQKILDITNASSTAFEDFLKLSERS